MEHRISKRVPGKLGSLLYKRGMPVATGQIRDASKSGLFLATDYAGAQIDETLELEFRFPKRNERHFRKLVARVVRRTDNGLGVKFEGSGNDAFTISYLLNWLQQHYMPSAYFSVLRQKLR
ncbi:PilZ domain-containing protein [Marinobacter salinisoli]|uniref:PilZ domain-containing protein n=1 Tax=Marinobacter salinisoli TaxID=2769486 RepID=A0ABX7MP16_9GAMM|nr:PilZ domain-containing protein [Marinobacter salinisoli]QSP93874.1 PilZ domain-containing protein [Marinobacter salinisoli]